MEMMILLVAATRVSPTVGRPQVKQEEPPAGEGERYIVVSQIF